jgi:hypothetical protein
MRIPASSITQREQYIGYGALGVFSTIAPIALVFCAY